MTTKLTYAHERDCEVGKTYLVAHALIMLDDILELVPIIPILHMDKDLGVDLMHYHIDGRFGMNTRVRSWYKVKGGSTGYFVHNSHIVKIIDTGFIPKRCIRVFGGINPPFKERWFYQSKYHQWYKSFIGKKCRGKKCPHWGAHMVRIGEYYVCPMHELHAKDGVIVKHPNDINNSLTSKNN